MNSFQYDTSDVKYSFNLRAINIMTKRFVVQFYYIIVAITRHDLDLARTCTHCKQHIYYIVKRIHIQL